MRVPNLSALQQSIESQQMAIAEADRRLATRVDAIRARSRAVGPALRQSGLVGALAGVGLWWFNRRRQRAVSYASARGDRLATVLQAAMPLLLPVIGARAATLLTALAAVPTSGGARVLAQGRPRPVAYVDLARYAGTWYEIARFPMLFERTCGSDVTATYEPWAGGDVRVINRCISRNERVVTAVGRARVQDSRSNAKLRVTFAPAPLQWLPFVWANYWILELGDAYDYALMGTPDRRYLWVLSRSPQLADGIYRTLVMQAAAQGYDVQKLERTEHREPR